MAGADGAEVSDGPEPVSASGVSQAEEEPEPELESEPDEGPETQKAPPPAYGGLRVHAVGAAPSKSSGEVRPSPVPSPSAWS